MVGGSDPGVAQPTEELPHVAVAGFFRSLLVLAGFRPVLIQAHGLSSDSPQPDKSTTTVVACLSDFRLLLRLFSRAGQIDGTGSRSRRSARVGRDPPIAPSVVGSVSGVMSNKSPSPWTTGLGFL